MSREAGSQAGQPRRTFLARMLAGLGATAALISRPRRARAAERGDTAAARPVLYRRSAETERYYRTLYR